MYQIGDLYLIATREQRHRQPHCILLILFCINFELNNLGSDHNKVNDKNIPKKKSIQYQNF